VSPRPAPGDVRAARGRTLRDVIGPGLDVLFVGINPGLYSAAVGHHFARAGNRFWPALHDAGFTPRRLTAFQDRELLRYRLGVTNLVARSTAAASELQPDELRAGRARLAAKVRRHRPRFVAVVGIGAYRVAFERPLAIVGAQDERLGDARLWVLPNTSGLNANHQAKDFARLFRGLHDAVGR
jgi:TDG/mug DNA glycosylase family protein